MLANEINNIFIKNNCAIDFFKNIDEGKDASLGLSSSARPMFASLCFEHLNGPLLVLLSGADSAHSFARQMCAFTDPKKVYEFSDYGFKLTDDRAIDPKACSNRFMCLNALATGQNVVVVASVSAVMRLLPNSRDNYTLPLVFSPGEELIVDDVIESLITKGYERVNKIKNRGDFSFVGGTLDVYPGNMDYPVRIDFFGDEIESIRKIFLSTGQTIKDVGAVEIYPVCELPLTKENKFFANRELESKAKTNASMRKLRNVLKDGINLKEAHLLMPHLCKRQSSFSDYLADNVTVAVCEPTSVIMEANKFLVDLDKELTGTSHKVDEFASSIFDISFPNVRHITFESIMRSVDVAVDDEVKILRTNSGGVEIPIVDRIKDWFDAGFKVLFADPDPNSARATKDDLLETGISIGDYELTEKIAPRVVNFSSASVPLGFVIPQAKFVLVSKNDSKGLLSGMRRSKSIDITKITFPYKPGDYVVHMNFGVGKFVRIVTRDIDGSKRDYMELHYAEGDKLFLPVEQLDRVTRYVGAEADNPRLTRLNTHDWSKAVNKARAATKKLAFDLVDVYSRRANVTGFPFEISDETKQVLSSTFEFDETKDQASAINDVFQDMHSKRIMDRLVCGDVGFGKTEVAIRAAFVAVKNKKQVMLLCPTTILAQQHFETFLNRLDPLGVNVDVISRFRTKKQQKETLAAFAEGRVDVLIGTHRLLSRDVNPKELGLMIVDEEQRFGVGHKEQLKDLRETIDVLTLSATPIPRTLQMSLSGVRDMSLILTPPKKRLPVKVHVSSWNPDVVSEALRFEFARGGQVYYVSNRVKTIDLTLQRVQEIVPEARIGVAHGQMSKLELEHVMEDFAAGKLDVLIATTIIESGIDNRNTNTLIIEDSERLGLAQMYQLKGRVGRSSVQAHAYFMFPDNMPLTEDSKSRLEAINEHQELGSGLRIAMRDLEIRGAGEMFGAEQSGNMSAVGFDLFAAMLNEAIINEREGNNEADDRAIHVLSDISVNINESARLSDDFIEDVAERVMLYRRVANAFSSNDVSEIFDEVKLNYGEMPDEALNYFAKAKLRSFCFENNITNISIAGGYLVVEPIDLSSESVASVRHLSALYSKNKKRLKVPFHNIDSGAGKCLDALSFLSDLL